jgi:bifunctional non-homologous end joining protein LigD
VASVSPYRAQLATLAEQPPSGREWLHELKYQGYRIGCTVEGGQIALVGRDGRDWTASFPEVVAAAGLLPVKSALLDGEIAIVLPSGTTSLQALQNVVSGGKRDGLTYFVFDLLHLNGENLAPLPLEQRKARCEKLLAQVAAGSLLRYSRHFDVDGPTLLKHACGLGAEAIVSKRRDLSYRPGRSAGWLKISCVERQGLLAGAVDAPQGSRATARAKVGTAVVRGVVITSPDRPVYPALGYTKLDLAKLYASLADRMLPYIAGRPLTLVRCEKGISQPDALRRECKFLRHEPGWHRWARPPIRRVNIQEQKKIGEYLVVDSAEALVSLIQGDISEISVWNATADAVETPDRIVFDLDPGRDVPWPRVVEVGRLLREELRARSLESWPKLTGGKGLHVVVPFVPEHAWAEVYAFSRVVAEAVTARDRQGLTLEFAKASRAEKILIDYKRNHRAAVAVAAYSTRTHPDGTLSVPISWRELTPELSPRQFTVHNVLARVVGQKVDPWRGFWKTRQRLAIGAMTTRQVSGR